MSARAEIVRLITRGGGHELIRLVVSMLGVMVLRTTHVCSTQCEAELWQKSGTSTAQTRSSGWHGHTERERERAGGGWGRGRLGRQYSQPRDEMNPRDTGKLA